MRRRPCSAAVRLITRAGMPCSTCIDRIHADRPCCLPPHVRLLKDHKPGRMRLNDARDAEKDARPGIIRVGHRTGRDHCGACSIAKSTTPSNAREHQPPRARPGPPQRFRFPRPLVLLLSFRSKLAWCLGLVERGEHSHQQQLEKGGHGKLQKRKRINLKSPTHRRPTGVTRRIRSRSSKSNER